ncbi:Alpha/beta hydrolase fold-3 [Penicillium concentricum]|uniref:Alpha/beta hydrolase fold-3 n=1 Tax=Penicillium concentricum TaxID=293559 RepID=A0A9W9VAN7_9EURO|nr:Alpha/beta hydrolase fold-3 [Penicillium concentricum]KAJ5375012.1 Alpha/beta hydrolase fold-3 [Penicillium concentricum]
MSSIHPQAGDQPRKKIRKGTRSCWQCKHRKVRCDFASDSDQSCRQCLARGLPCRSQEFLEPENPRDSDRTYLNERMARVETLLEKLLIRVDGNGNGSSQHGDSKSFIDWVETSPGSSPPTVTPTNQAVSATTRIGLGFEQSDPPAPDLASYATINRDWERLRRDLIAMIPSKETLKIISEASSSWWLMRVQFFEDYDQSLLSSSVETLQTSHPAVVGKAILWIALCLQQLPSECDLSSLGLSCLPSVLVEECITRVSTFVCADDSIVSCLDGLECLISQGLLFSNDEKLRSAWLSTRRAADIAQVIGFHRAEPASNRSAEFQNRASDPQDLPVHNASALNPLARIAGLIIDRNQIFTEVTPAMIQMTQIIDAELQSFTPPPLESPDNIPPGKSIKRSNCFLELHYRLWYYQLMVWLHLPLLLASGTDNSYEYNRKACLQACRHCISCYDNLRRTTESGFDSKVLHFQAFATVMTIIMNRLGPFGSQDFDKEDHFVIDRIEAILQPLSKTVSPDKTATRGLHVLRTIMAIGIRTELPRFDASEGQYHNGRLSRIKLDIPFFGRVQLERRAFADQSSKSFTVPTTVPGQYYPSSSRMLTIPEPGYLMEQVAETAQRADDSLCFDPSNEFWAFNSQFTFQPPFLADFDFNWDNWGMNVGI